jgi:hypothetical protein
MKARRTLRLEARQPFPRRPHADAQALRRFPHVPTQLFNSMNQQGSTCGRSSGKTVDVHPVLSSVTGAGLDNPQSATASAG